MNHKKIMKKTLKKLRIFDREYTENGKDLVRRTFQLENYGKEQFISGYLDSYYSEDRENIIFVKLEIKGDFMNISARHPGFSYSYNNQKVLNLYNEKNRDMINAYIDSKSSEDGKHDLVLDKNFMLNDNLSIRALSKTFFEFVVHQLYIYPESDKEITDMILKLD